jgi:uncharacterized membrane protein YgcG
MIGRLRWIAAGTALPLLLLAFWLCGDGSAFAAEVIHSFDSTVQVAKDGTLTVSETLRVRAEGYEIKRGIFRDFPLTFKDAAGGLHEVTFDLLDVTRDGKPEPHFTKHVGNAIRIYVGQQDVLIPRGDHVYVIRYRTGRQIRWFDGKPELNWNVTGNFWHFPILTATYRLHLVDEDRPLRWTAYTGRMGARGADWQGVIDDAGVLTVATTRRLAPGEGLTVVAALPAGAVAPPGPATQLWYAMLDNRRWIFGTFGFVLVFGYYFAAWNAVGRDPKRGTIIPLFHPPDGVSPALANYVHNWGLAREKWRAFTAAALSLAVRGLIRFDEKDKTLTLKATGRQPAGEAAALPSGERTILTWVNGQGGIATINRANGSKVATVGSDFTTSIETENRNRFFRRNFGYATAGLLLTAAVVFGVVTFGGLRDNDIVIMIVLGFSGLMLGVFVVPLLLMVFGSGRFPSVVRGVLTLIVVSIFVSIFFNIILTAFPQGVDYALPLLWSVVAGYPFSFVLVTTFAALNGLFIYLMRAPTALGRPVMDQLDGFKLYLETAESDRLNLQAPEITTERFEALLPFAVALDVEKPWSQAFAAALRRAHPGEADPMQHYQPTWHSGSGWSGSNFSSAVAATIAGTSAALASAVPVSSGSSGFSSGGGGSGGGGGGGGGGGW